MEKLEVKLSENWIKKLQELPETGMGYQLVDLTLINGKIFKYAIVLNCSIVILEEKIDVSQIEKIELSEL
ncbi:hypothetical protein LCGC14_1001660 [marine sediment metagenome]|uniref:Uncharacterized protein n=1 Tax=marine sediment metagenome TaxID=412755 RepID=A0A0F9NPC0_9ZZZZ